MSTTPGQLNHDIIESSATPNSTPAAVDQNHLQISTLQEVSSSVLDNTPLPSNIQSSCHQVIMTIHKGSLKIFLSKQT